MQTATRFALCPSCSCYPTPVSWHHQPHACRWPARPEEEEKEVMAALCCHKAHPVPVELLLCEPEGQGAPPASGHRGNTVRIYRTRGEAHQSTTAGFHSSLKAQKTSLPAPTNILIKDLKRLEWLTVTVLASLLVKNNSPPSKLSFR